MEHEIIASAYQRKNSSMELLKHSHGWILRDVNGLCYFWRPSDSKWVIAHTLTSFEEYTMPLEQGLKLLATIPSATS